MKLNELKALVRAWQKERSVTIAYDICTFLAENLNLEDERSLSTLEAVECSEQIREHSAQTQEPQGAIREHSERTQA